MDLYNFSLQNCIRKRRANCAPPPLGGLLGAGFRHINTQVKETDKYLGMYIYHSR